MGRINLTTMTTMMKISMLRTAAMKTVRKMLAILTKKFSIINTMIISFMTMKRNKRKIMTRETMNKCIVIVRRRKRNWRLIVLLTIIVSGDRNLKSQKFLCWSKSCSYLLG